MVRPRSNHLLPPPSVNPGGESPSIAVDLVPTERSQLRRQSRIMFNRSSALSKFALIALVLAGVCFVVGAAQAGQAPSATVAIPKTPAGEQFSAWLAAFNSGDRAELEKFRSHFDKPDEHKVEGMLGFRRQTGGFDLKKIEESSATKLTGLVQERDSDQF